MHDFVINLFSTGSFIPHGHCYLWKPGLVWLHIISDGTIALAYYSIPLTLFYFVRKRQDLPFFWIFLLFAAFIVFCGTTHISEIWTLWHPTYWLSGVLKAATAIVSLFTAIELILLLPQALALPSPLQLREANKALHIQIEERLRVENQLRRLQEELEQRVQDRTAQLVKVNQQLQQTLQTLTTLIQASPLPIVVIEPNMTVQLWNLAAEKLFGWSAVEVIGQPMPLVPQEKPEECRQFREAIAKGEVFTGIQTYRCHPDGAKVVVSISTAPLYDEHHNFQAILLIFQDITEQKAIEQMKNEFISIVSHELRTPLTAIQGFLGLLNTGIYDNKPEKAKRMIRQALTNSDRLIHLVNDILDLERLSSGRVHLVKEVCNAIDLMQRAVEEVQSIALAAGITISINPSTTRVWANPDLIIQTLTNLLSNAIKFSPHDSRITLFAQPQADYVLFEVKDQGRGIPADKLEIIFERFQQVDISDARAKGGTGLGLAICQSIIQQHDGSIWVESTLGKGSTFYFTLPMPVY